jgi:hypothetical protein
MNRVKNGGKGSRRCEQLPLFDADPADDVDRPGNITAEQALAILKEHGMDVSLEQAKQILSFLRQIIAISLTQNIHR